MSNTPNTYIHPKDFIKTATPINDIINDAKIVWLVDFVLQIASVIRLSMYEQGDWTGCSAPTQKFFVDFLAAQQSKIQKSPQTLHNFLNEGVKLVPVYEDSTCRSFTVGFLLDDIAHFVCPKVFTIESETTELFYELAKNIPKKSQAFKPQAFKAFNFDYDKIKTTECETQLDRIEFGKFVAEYNCESFTLKAGGSIQEEARLNLKELYERNINALSQLQDTVEIRMVPWQ